MKSKLTRFFLGVAVVAAIGFLFVPIHPVTSLSQSVYLELVPPAQAPGVLEAGQGGPAIPPDGSIWHELWPNFCMDHVQNSYDDANGDNEMSVCDNFVLDGVTYHVDWVGPTYLLVPTSGPDTWTEPSLDPNHNPDDPVGEVWHQVYPDFCTEFPIDGWEDNGDGTLSPCDLIYSGGVEYHLADVGVNVITSESGVPVRRSTWGQIKDLFHRVF